MRPERALADLRELHELTSVGGGARRLAWTDGWAAAREWLRARLAELPVAVEVDPAGNLWASLPGTLEGNLLVGSHIDAVPDGGWLDGTLGVVAALELLRGLSRESGPRQTVTLVDWADEEGARFGRSLFGSSAAAGTLAVDPLRALCDRDGVSLTDALAAHGVELDRVGEASGRLGDVIACVELHIEQGPVLDEAEVGVGVVTGTLGVERHTVRFSGQGGHAGGAPMHLRRDALVAAARLAVAVRDAARTSAGVATTGAIDARPGVVTAVAGTASMLLDQRHADRRVLAEMWSRAAASAREIAAQEGVAVDFETLQQIDPVPFDDRLVGLAADAVERVLGAPAPRLPSGPLHDAASLAAVGVPTVMLFARSLGGVSHAPQEDSRPEDLAQALRALGALCRSLLGPSR